MAKFSFFEYKSRIRVLHSAVSESDRPESYITGYCNSQCGLRHVFENRDAPGKEVAVKRDVDVTVSMDTSNTK